MSLHFFDFECYEKLWTVVFMNPQRRTKTVIVNDRDRLEEYYNQYKKEIFVGFNSRHYDVWIMRAILCGFNPKRMSDWLIEKDADGRSREGWKFSDLVRKNYNDIINYDVMTDKGLKTLEGYMGNDIRETSIPFDYDGDFTPAMIDEVIKYNTHDVEQTMEVFKRRVDDFNAQVELLNTYKLPRICMGMTQTQLVAEILGAERIRTYDEWDIFLPPTLKLSKYQYVADWFMNKKNHNKNRYLSTPICGVKHNVAWGGLHGAKTKFAIECSPGYVLLMADVDQLYPSLMVYYDLMSRAVSDPSRFREILHTSLRLKAEGKKKERAPYKLVCNKAYGAMGDPGNKMFDPRNRRLVCIFGQLLIIDLLEKLESFIELIQSNTDGILVKIRREDRARFDAVMAEWQERTMLNLSFNEYRKVVQKDVSSYIAFDFDGGIKTKGTYVKELNDLDNDLPIINRALNECIINGVPVEKTIMECDDLIQFQRIVKVSDKYLYGIKDATFSKVKVYDDNGKGKWVNVWNGDGERMKDKTFRVFASRRKFDGGLHKVKLKDGREKPEKFASTPEKCFIWNDSVKGISVPPHLDKQWYVEEAKKRLKQFGVTA